MNFTKPRGTVDLINFEAEKFTLFESILRIVASKYNFFEIKTPIFESKQLFTKAVGDTSDIVNKEFYDFLDKGGREIALRPEGTAGTIRAIVENKLLNDMQTPLKVYYIGPMFRYERPQSGRQRQFHQFGIECVGNLTNTQEIECVCFAISVLNACKIKKYTLEINNIGDASSRLKWMKALKIYFKPFKDQLTEDSQKRLEANPLRILDDKIDGSKDFVKKAPKLDEFLTNDDKKYFENIKQLLDMLGIKYNVNQNLVRGLDYYNGLVFEFISSSNKLKGQSTLIGGGRYNSLVKETGGPDVAGFGFGMGIERMLIAIDDESPDFFKHEILDIVIAPLSDKALNVSVVLSMVLRELGYKVGINYNTFKIDKHFKYATNNQSKYVFIIGEKELEKDSIIIKDQVTKKEVSIKINDIEKFMKGK